MNAAVDLLLDARKHLGDTHGPNDCARFVSAVFAETGHGAVFGSSSWVPTIVNRLAAHKSTSQATALPADLIIFGKSAHVMIASGAGRVIGTATSEKTGLTTVVECSIASVSPPFSMVLHTGMSVMEVQPPTPPTPPPPPPVQPPTPPTPPPPPVEPPTPPPCPPCPECPPTPPPPPPVQPPTPPTPPPPPVQPPTPPTPPPPPVVNEYVVQEGDNLHSIAAATLGDAAAWGAIYAANRARIGPNPGAIRVGLRLVIPHT